VQQELLEEHYQIIESRDFTAYLAKKLRGFPAVGDVPTAVEDVKCAVTVAMWQNLDVLAQMATPLERRKSTYAYARIQAMQYARNALREAERAQRAGLSAYQQSRRNGLLVGDPQEEDAPDREDTARAVLAAAIAAVPGVGSAGISELARRANRSEKTRRDLVAAYEAAAQGVVPDVGHIVAPILKGTAWAVARLRAGQSLSSAVAVKDGAYPSAGRASRALTELWVAHRRPEAGPVCYRQVFAAGLVDHVVGGIAKQLHAAHQRAIGLIGKHPHLAGGCSPTHPADTCCNQADAHHGVAIETLKG
jgi:hypothetical protein